MNTEIFYIFMISCYTKCVCFFSLEKLEQGETKVIKGRFKTLNPFNPAPLTQPIRLF